MHLSGESLDLAFPLTLPQSYLGLKARLMNLHGACKSEERMSSIFPLMPVELMEQLTGIAITTTWNFRFTDQMGNKGNCKISSVVIFYRSDGGVCTVTLHLTGSFVSALCFFFFFLAHRK